MTHPKAHFVFCVGVWFGFVGSALLLAVGTHMSFQAMPCLCCNRGQLLSPCNTPKSNNKPTMKCWLCAESVLSLGVCENRDGWLVAWGLCGCMLIRFSAV